MNVHKVAAPKLDQGKLIREWKDSPAVLVEASANHNTKEHKPPVRHRRTAEIGAEALRKSRDSWYSPSGLNYAI